MKSIKNLLSDSFIRNIMIFFTGSMAAAFLNYLYHPVLGRLMLAADFGEAQTIISIVAQFNIILAAFSVIIVNITANTEDERERRTVVSGLGRWLFFSVLIISFIIIFFAGELQSFFQFQNIYPFWALAASMPLTAVIVWQNAYLQGQSRFKTLTVANTLSAAGRLIFSALLVLAGWRAFGAVFGIFLGQLLTFFFLYRLIGKDLRFLAKIERTSEETKKIKKQLSYGWLVLFVSGGITFLATADVAVVKHYFSPEIAGHYSGVSLVAKIIFYAAGPIISVMFPAVKLRNTQRQNGTVLLKSLLLVLFIGLGGYLTFSLFSAKVIYLLIGGKYLAYAAVLNQVALTMLLVSLCNLFFNYLLAYKRRYLVVIALAAVAANLSLNVWRHDTIEAVTGNFLISAAFALAMLASALALEFRRYFPRIY